MSQHPYRPPANQPNSGQYGFVPQNQPAYGQPPQPGPEYPQKPTRSASSTQTRIIVALGIIILALAVIVAYLAIFKEDNSAPTPTPTPTPTLSKVSEIPKSTAPTPKQSPTSTLTPTPGRGWTINSNQLTGRTMTAQLPPGWRLSEENGARNDGEIIGGKSRITYWFDVRLTPEDSCNHMIEDYRKSSSDPVEKIPGKSWAGKPALMHRVTNVASRSSTYTFYCVDTGNGTSALLQLSAWTENNEQVDSAAQTILTTWKWK